MWGWGEGKEYSSGSNDSSAQAQERGDRTSQRHMEEGPVGKTTSKTGGFPHPKEETGQAQLLGVDSEGTESLTPHVSMKGQY